MADDRGEIAQVAAKQGLWAALLLLWLPWGSGCSGILRLDELVVLHLKAEKARRGLRPCLLPHSAKAVSAETEPTCFPLACPNIHHGGMVLFCEVLEQDHVVLFVGVVDEHRLGAHTQHLTHTHTQEQKESQPSSKKKMAREQGTRAHTSACTYFTYLGETHQHQQGEEVGAFECLWELLNAVVSEGADDCAPVRTSIQTV